MNTECVVCHSTQDLLIACRTCRRHGWCANCDKYMDKCPICRTSFSTRNVIIQRLPNPASHSNFEEDEQYHEIAGVLDFDRETEHFLIQWADGDVTWEPSETIVEDAPEAVDNFLAQQA